MTQKMRIAVHSVVVEFRMLARPLEIRSSPHPMEIHGMTALVTAMIAKPITRPRHPGPNSGLPRASTIRARATNPEIERKSRSAVGLMSWTVTLMARKDPPQINDNATNAAYGSSGRLLDTCHPLVGRQHERDRAVVLDGHTHDGSKAPGLRLYSALPKPLHEQLVELLGAPGIAGLEQAWPAPLAHVREQGELGHDQGRALDVGQAQVHAPGLVGEDAQVDDLVREPLHRAFVVIATCSHQQHKAGADGCSLAVPADRAGGDALGDYPQAT